MSNLSRRKLITGGLVTAAGTYVLAGRLADHYGLLPPDQGELYGTGAALTYAAQRLLTRNTFAREFPRTMISKAPFANETAPPSADYKRLQAGGFAEWRLAVDGMVARPASLSVAELKSYPSRSQITHIACEEGWSYIAEWTGVPLSHVLNTAGISPKAKYVVYFSIERDWWDSVDMDDAMHPQTLVTYGMNGSDLPAGHGAPLRLRVPRQLAYKSVKFINHLTVTDNLKSFGKGLGSTEPDSGYSWYAGI
jgi:DMSO/TMAO reductase YedYZ molybdopterin-dependent catalytic subunit